MPEPLDYESPTSRDDEPVSDRDYALAPLAGCFGALAAVVATLVLLAGGVGCFEMFRRGHAHDSDPFGLIVINFIGLVVAYFAFCWIRDAVRGARSEGSGDAIERSSKDARQNPRPPEF